MSEQMILNEAGVVITRTRFTVPGQTYAINGITSVGVREKRRAIWSGIVVFLGSLLLAGAAGQSSSALSTFIVLGGIVGCFVVWFRAPNSVLFLRTAGGEVQALEGTPEWIYRVTDALERAIVDRSAAPSASVSVTPPVAQSTTTKVCPQCAESVQMAAKICRYCRYDFGSALAN